MNKLPYDKNKNSACDPTDENVRKQMLDDFDPEEYNPYSNIWKRSISDRQFYTLPSTGIVNNQTKFAKWLYGSDKTCKIDSSTCLKKETNSKYHHSRYI